MSMLNIRPNFTLRLKPAANGQEKERLKLGGIEFET
jgi:hypothetical protein